MYPPKLQRWVRVQRRAAAQGTLRAERRELLEGVCGFTLDPWADAWAASAKAVAELGGIDGPLPPKLRRWARKQQRKMQERNRQKLETHGEKAVSVVPLASALSMATGHEVQSPNLCQTQQSHLSSAETLLNRAPSTRAPSTRAPLPHAPSETERTLQDLRIRVADDQGNRDSSDQQRVSRMLQEFSREEVPADGFCLWRLLHDIMEQPCSLMTGRKRRRRALLPTSAATIRQFISRVADMHEAAGVCGRAFRTPREVKARVAALREEARKRSTTATCWAEAAEIRLAVEAIQQPIHVFRTTPPFHEGVWTRFDPVSGLRKQQRNKHHVQVGPYSEFMEYTFLVSCCFVFVRCDCLFDGVSVPHCRLFAALSPIVVNTVCLCLNVLSNTLGWQAAGALRSRWLQDPSFGSSGLRRFGIHNRVRSPALQPIASKGSSL